MRYVCASMILLLCEAVVNPARCQEKRPIHNPSPAARQTIDDELAEAASTEPYSPVRTGKSKFDWAWLAAHFDSNQNTIITRKELNVSPEIFSRLDRTRDQVLTAEDFDWSPDGPLCRQKETAFALFKSVDKNSDGRMTTEEWQALFTKASESKGYLDEEDLETLINLPRVLKSLNEYKSRASHVTFQFDDHGKLPKNLPEPGMNAPDFELSTPDGSKTVRLSSFEGQKPVLLIFGCLTCGNYRVYSETLETMYQRYKDEVQFIRVYVREAHPSDTHSPTATNAKAGILIKQAATTEERCQVANRFTRDLQIDSPVVVDRIDNQVGLAYGAWPDRLYLIDKEGKVIYQGGPGPFAFNPREMEQSLLLLQIEERMQRESQRNGTE